MPSRKRQTQPKQIVPFDKYKYYSMSVQSPKPDVLFFENTYISQLHQTPKSLREDFCGTFMICCEWVKLDNYKVAHGVDLSAEPLDYGKKYYLPMLRPEQKDRIYIHKKNVLKHQNPKVDLTVAVNFSYFTFKDRNIMLQYFKNIYRSLNNPGMFILDIFGGSETQLPNEEETEFSDQNYSYFWDQASYNPINHHAEFYIHFKRKGESKRKKVFRYDWRMWSIPEIRDLLKEAGFKKSVVYWEGTNKKGEGNGKYKQIESTDEICDSYIAYIAAVKS